MGNRGCLHDAAGRLSGRPWRSRAWIICRLQWKGRRLPLMTAGRYTQLFFLDEPTALAAGHRPCHACRREDARRYLAAAHPAVAACAGARRGAQATASTRPAASGASRRRGRASGRVMVAAPGAARLGCSGAAPCGPVAQWVRLARGGLARLGCVGSDARLTVAAIANGYAPCRTAPRGLTRSRQGARAVGGQGVPAARGPRLIPRADMSPSYHLGPAYINGVKHLGNLAGSMLRPTSTPASSGRGHEVLYVWHRRDALRRSCPPRPPGRMSPILRRAHALQKRVV